MTDQQIILGLRRNERETTQYVYKTLAPPLFKYVLSNSGMRDDAKDLFQETFIKVLKNIQELKYKAEEKFEAYFLRVARNTWIDHLRKKKGHKVVSDDDFLLQRADDADEDALMQLIVHDNRLEVLNTVWTSWEDTDCHRVLDAYHYKGKSTKEIADTEGVPQNTILKRLFDCRKKLFRLVSKQLEQKNNPI